MNGEKEELRLLENIVTELQHLKQAAQTANANLSTIVKNQNTIILNQMSELSKLDQIIQNTTPLPSDDITSLGGSISPPTKKTP